MYKCLKKNIHIDQNHSFSLFSFLNSFSPLILLTTISTNSWCHSSIQWNSFKLAVPNLFATREQFHGGQFFHRQDWTGWGGGDDLGMTQVWYIHCAFYFYYYYISSTSDHQALDPGDWDPCFKPCELSSNFLKTSASVFHFKLHLSINFLKINESKSHAWNTFFLS